jgi:hypothetical protein
VVGKVTEAVQLLVDSLPVELASVPEAALALELAERVDSASNATAAANAAGRFMEAIDRLRALAPEKSEVTPLDEIRARRDLRTRQAKP